MKLEEKVKLRGGKWLTFGWTYLESIFNKNNIRRDIVKSTVKTISTQHQGDVRRKVQSMPEFSHETWNSKDTAIRVQSQTQLITFTTSRSIANHFSF